MNRVTEAASLAVLAGIVGLGTFAQSQEAAPAGQQVPREKELLATWQASPYHRVMWWSSVDVLDPATVLALRGYLGLSDEQIAKLEAVAPKASEEAKAVLSDAQKGRLASSAYACMGMPCPMMAHVAALERPDAPPAPAAPPRAWMGCGMMGW